MKKKFNIGSLLAGSFLSQEWIMKNFPFIIYVTFLALLMIRSSHSADRKVHRISTLNSHINELQSEYLETKSRLMQLGLESTIIERTQELGLKAPSTPPKKLIVRVDE